MGTKGKDKPKIIVVLGPTASGKSDLAVRLSLRFSGEVVSADSRQVYRGMDIGSGKITTEEMRGVPHHLLDVASPKRKFTVAQYQSLAKTAVQRIVKREKVPMICGGTSFYITSLVDGVVIPEISPDWKLRKELDKKTTESLYQELKRKDSSRAKNIDKNNRRRLIRAVEIIRKSKKSIPKIKKNSPYSPLFLEIKVDQKLLNKKIEKRLDKRLKQGMIKEVKKLRKSGISWKRLEEFGLEYKWVAQYLQNKIDYDCMYENILMDSQKLAKKQLAWWKKDKKINRVKNYREAEKLTQNFLSSP